MDVREKLVELQLQADLADNVSENTTQHREFTSDFMMANGVTVQDEPLKVVVSSNIDEKELMERLRNAPIQIMPSDPVQEWISVKDRLPEPGEYVLVCDTREDWYGLWEFSGVAWYDASYQPWSIDEVTHWQYLPQPPKGE